MRTHLVRQRGPAIIITVLCALLLLLLSSGAMAQEPEQEVSAEEVNAVARDLYCPLCTGTTVDICPLDVCKDMRQDIASQLQSGRTPDEIKTYFVQQYGQQVLGHPATQGFDLIAWILPFVVLLLAGGILIAWLRQRPSPLSRATAVPETTVSEYSARLDRELQRLDD